MELKFWLPKKWLLSNPDGFHFELPYQMKITRIIEAQERDEEYEDILFTVEAEETNTPIAYKAYYNNLKSEEFISTIPEGEQQIKSLLCLKNNYRLYFIEKR